MNDRLLIYLEANLRLRKQSQYREFAYRSIELMSTFEN